MPDKLKTLSPPNDSITIIGNEHMVVFMEKTMERYFELADKTPFLMKCQIHTILVKKIQEQNYILDFTFRKLEPSL